jgi:hypothetical protein
MLQDWLTVREVAGLLISSNVANTRIDLDSDHVKLLSGLKKVGVSD